jgi:hypothetical protein
MVADPAACAGKGVLLLEQFQRFCIFFLLHQGNKSLDGHMGRTGGFAGRNRAFGNAVSPGNGLFILFENRFALVEPFIMLTGGIHRTDFGAFPAGGTLGYIDKSRFFFDSGREISLFTIQFQKFGIRQQLYVQMPADLDQFG